MRSSKLFLLVGVLDLCFLIGVLPRLQAQEEVASQVESSASAQEASGSGTWKQELISDRQALKEQHQSIAENAQAAKQEEQQIKDQIHQAIQSGDYETARSLKDQFKETHQENIEQIHGDIQEFQESRQEFKNDLQSARQEKRDYQSQGEGETSGFNPPGASPNNPPGRDLPPGLRDKAEKQI